MLSLAQLSPSLSNLIPFSYFRAEECAQATNKTIQGSAVTLLWNLTNILLSVSKCQKSLEERNRFVKLPACVRELLSFWKESHHKQNISQQLLEQLIGSIQIETSKAAMVSGGILSKLRAGLLESLPVFEKHKDYLHSMISRKEKQKSEASTAVECVVENIGDREKITIIEIGGDECMCDDVEKIVRNLISKEFYQPVNISTMLPVNRKQRHRILNKFLVRQSPVKLGLWTFNNHGTAPQSVFAFLVNLEDNTNTIMKYVLEMRTELLKQQKIQGVSQYFGHLATFNFSASEAPRIKNFDIFGKPGQF